MFGRRFTRRGWFSTNSQADSNQTGSRRGGGRGGRGGGRGSKPGSGPNGFCVCPSCGHREEHVAGQRCLDRVCSKCGTKMVRE